MKPKEYEIKTLEDIANCVNVSNIENFLEGFSDGLRQYVKLIELSREMLKSNNKKYKNTDLIKYKQLTYIDDKKQDNEIKII